MTRRLKAAALAAALAVLPLGALATGDKPATDKSGSSPSATPTQAQGGAPPATGTGSMAAPAGADGGAAAMFKSLDKNSDGFISREEARGTPHEKDFAKLDKDGDGKLSPAEHAAAPEHTAGKAAK